MLKQFFVLMILYRPLFAEPQVPLHRTVRRAAIDIGSVQIKMQVADVDIVTNKIAQTLFNTVINVPLREDLAKSTARRFSQEIQNTTIEVINELVRQSAPFGPQCCYGIATEPFRNAKNGKEFSDRITQETGVPISIIPPQEEGILGFLTAVNEANTDPEKTIAWDIGGGSFQITTKYADEYPLIVGKMGEIPVKNLLLQMQGKSAPCLSPNPVSSKEAISAIQKLKVSIKEIPKKLKEKLRHPNITVLGIGANPLWGMPQSSSYDIHRILKELNSRLYLSDDAIKKKDALANQNPDIWPAFAYVVPDLILAYGVMEKLGIRQVRHIETKAGNTTGVLLFSKYWKNSKTPDTTN